MFTEGLRWATSIAAASTEVMVSSAQTVFGDDVVDIRPRNVRSLLLTLEDSIHGRIPEILGDDEEERVETLARLLKGTSEEDMSGLIRALQLALIRLSR
ncbi:MAG: hypothetical protein ACRDY7_00350 [Acidimicrobiia bacterium]